MPDDKYNRYIKCPVCGVIGNWPELIAGGFCHKYRNSHNGVLNQDPNPADEEEEEFTEEELAEIMEEYSN